MNLHSSITLRTVLVGLFLSTAGLFAASPAMAGSLDASGTTSYSLEDVYNRLNSGSAGTASGYSGPAAGPTGGTMHTVNEIMGAAPSVDDSNGAGGAGGASGSNGQDGGKGGNGGSAFGGAVYNAGTLAVDQLNFYYTSNSVTGGSGGIGGGGGGGGGGYGSPGTSGIGQSGGSGGGGGYYYDPVLMMGETEPDGGNGGNGGDILFPAGYSGGTGSCLYFCSGAGGLGGTVGAIGNALSADIYNAGTLGNLITVDTADDNTTADGKCTLREAMLNVVAGGNPSADCAAGSGGNDRIVFAGDYTITLASELYLGAGQLTIAGNGVTKTILQASTCDPVTLPGGCTPADYRVLTVGASGDLTLDNVTVRYGQCSGSCVTSTNDGGGIYAAGGLTLSNSTFEDNVATTYGSALYSEGTLDVSTTTFSGNHTDGDGTLAAFGTANIRSSTFDNNSVPNGGGGGIYSDSSTTLYVSNSTFANNTAAQGGAIHNRGAATFINNTFAYNDASGVGRAIHNWNGTLSLYNNIISSNTGTASADCANEGVVNNSVNNLIDDGSCSATFTSDPLLSALGDHGGSTQTFALQVGSPAIDAGDDASCTEDDQRGGMRPQGAHCDIGSFETGAVTVTPVVGANGSMDPATAQQIAYGGGAIAFTITPDSTYAIESISGCNGSMTDATIYTIGDNLFSDCSVAVSFTTGPVNGLCGSADGQAFTSEPLMYLCSSGTPTTKSGSGPWTWTCAGANGGSDANCSADIRTWTVTPFAGADGTISPDTPLIVSHGSTTSFTITPDPGASIAGVTGCNGSLAGNTYTTGAISSDCTVTAIFSGIITVNTAADNTTAGDGYCTLREAISNVANSGDSSDGDCAAGDGSADQIVFAGDYTITLDGSELSLGNAQVTIAGNGVTKTIVQASTCDPVTLPGGCTPADYRVLSVGASGDLTLDGVTVRYGQCSGSCSTWGVVGGGIYAQGKLTVSNSTFEDNVATTYGSALYSEGTLDISTTTFSGNYNSAANGGGTLANFGTASIYSSTFDDNSVKGGGGGIYSDLSTTLSVYNSTFAYNTAGQGGAIHNRGAASVINNTFAYNDASGVGRAIHNWNGTLSLKNNIVSNNTGTASAACYNEGVLSDSVNNLIDDGTCSASLTADPLLHALGDYGGSTLTFALRTGSPAIDAGDDATCEGVDQRDITRPQGAHCDIGSFETTTYSVTPTTGAHGTIDPSTVQQIAYADTTVFTMTPDAGYAPSVTGCGGSLSGNTYTTGAIVSDCTVTATFLIAPVLTAPTTTLVGANIATVTLQSDTTGRGYITVLLGSGTACGTGDQVKNGLDSTGAAAYRIGSLPLTANVAADYTVRNLAGSTAYTVCFAASGEVLQPVPATTDFTTTAAIDLTNAKWTTVGNAEFSANQAQASYPSLYFAPDGTPFVAYADSGNSSKATVMKYDGSSWVAVGGGGFTAGFAAFPSLAIAPDGTPYVAYGDLANGNKATVMHYSSGSWTTAGSADFSAGEVNYLSLAVAPDGTPYVAYQDKANGNKATVMRYSAGSWTTVGSAGFSAGNILRTSLAFAPDGTPFIACKDGGNGSKATVMKYDGSSWVAVGSAGFSAGTASDLSLAFAPDGTPFIAYADGGNSGNATVMQFNGSSWVAVGSPGFTAGGSSDVRLAFAPDGTPYIAYVNYPFSNEVKVMKYTDSGWVSVGTPGLSWIGGDATSLAFAPDGTPYVAFADTVNDNYAATVMKLAQAYLSVSPSSKDFGTVAPGSSSSAQTFTIQNTGTNNLYVGTITKTGTYTDQFSVQNDNCSGQTVAPTGTCTLQTVFSPTSVGTKSASLSIPSNAAGSPTAVELTGTGATVPSAATDPATSVGETSAMLNGTVAPNGLATTAWFEWGTSTGYGNRLPESTGASYDVGSSGSTSIMGQLGGLTADTEYHYRVVAENSAGTSYGDDQTFTTGTIGSSCAAHKPIMIDGGPEYDLFADANVQMLNGDVILMGPTPVVEVVNINVPGLSILIEGGWNCDFGLRTGTISTIQGSMTITAGTVEVDGVRIK